MLHANIDGVDFVALGALPRDRAALVIAPDGFEGWDDATAVRREVVELPNADGSFAGRGTRDSRVVSLSGIVVARTAEEVEELGLRLTGVLARGGAGRLTVRRATRTTFATAYLHGQPRFVVDGLNPTTATWQIQFWLPSPRKYGDLNTFTAPAGEGVEVFHRGNYAGSPVVTVTGSMPGYSIEGLGGSLTVGRAVTPATPHVIDFATGLVSIGGAVQVGAITRGGPWTVPPGRPAGVHRLIPASGTGAMRVDLRDTII